MDTPDAFPWISALALTAIAGVAMLALGRLLSARDAPDPHSDETWSEWRPADTDPTSRED